MDYGYWFTVVAIFLSGLVMVKQSINYYRSGVYTKTFKGTTRCELIQKADQPHAYWFNLSLHMLAGVGGVYFSLWFLQFDPTVKEWYEALIESLSLRILMLFS